MFIYFSFGLLTAIISLYFSYTYGNFSKKNFIKNTNVITFFDVMLYLFIIIVWPIYAFLFLTILIFDLMFYLDKKLTDIVIYRRKR